MKLGEAQILFSTLISQHVIWVNVENGLGENVRVKYGELAEFLTEKDPTSDHMKNSNHHKGLAGDLLLFVNGVYQRDYTAHHASAVKWESRHPLCRAGYRFHDGEHYSLFWDGVM